MTRTIALLRGINVGGHGKLPMKALTALLEDLGCRRVATYIQSGNVVFDAPSTAGLAKRIADAVHQAHGFAPEVLLLSAAQLRRVVAANPYPEGVAEPTSLQVYFLAATPRQPDLDALDALRGPREAFHLAGKVFYLHAADGIGRSKLATAVERRLGVPATARNWRTVTRLIELAAAPDGGGDGTKA